MSDEDLSDAKWLRELATENELSLARTERWVMNRIADRLEALTAEVEARDMQIEILTSGLCESEMKVLALTAENAKLRAIIVSALDKIDHGEAAEAVEQLRRTASEALKGEQ